MRSTGYNINVIGNTKRRLNLIKTRNRQKYINITTRLPSIGQFRQKSPKGFCSHPFQSRKINFLTRVILSEHRPKNRIEHHVPRRWLKIRHTTIAR